MTKAKEFWWCNTHQREATHIRDCDGRHCCAPNLGGILLICAAVNLTGQLEIDNANEQLTEGSK